MSRFPRYVSSGIASDCQNADLSETSGSSYDGGRHGDQES